MGAGDRHLMKRKLQLQGMSASDGMLLKKTRRSEEEGYGILEASKEAVAAVRLMRFHHPIKGCNFSRSTTFLLCKFSLDQRI